jgi:Bax protein
MFSFLFAGFPDYYYKLPIKKQKKEFQKILLPIINKINNDILKQREIVEKIFATKDFNKSKKNIEVLKKLAKEYYIKNIFDKEAFLKKIDTIPTKLVLAQGAIESGWARSHFAKKANNIFGQWDYSGKGLVPKNRDVNKTHTIRIFSSIEESVFVYMRNLNRNRAYRKFRKLRYEYRKKHKKYTADVAATTLVLYSQLRKKYVRILQKIIKEFHLKQNIKQNTNTKKLVNKINSKNSDKCQAKIRKIVKNLLKLKVDENIIAKSTGLSIIQINKLK